LDKNRPARIELPSTSGLAAAKLECEYYCTEDEHEDEYEYE